MSEKKLPENEPAAPENGPVAPENELVAPANEPAAAKEKPAAPENRLVAAPEKTRGDVRGPFCEACDIAGSARVRLKTFLVSILFAVVVVGALVAGVCYAGGLFGQTSSLQEEKPDANLCEDAGGGEDLEQSTSFFRPSYNLSESAVLPQAQPECITAVVSIDTSRAALWASSSSPCVITVTLPLQSSAYDALVATGLAVDSSAGYVSSIDGLAQRAFGAGSGWIYFVDGKSCDVGCESYMLSGGETIEWIYTCDFGRDIE